VSGLTLNLPPEVVEQLAQRVADILQERAGEERTSAEAARWLTIAQAAAHIGARPQRIYDLRQSGRLSRHGDGRRALIDRHELDQLITRTTATRRHA
jgi:excisionase family DNA binding protein